MAEELNTFPGCVVTADPDYNMRMGALGVVNSVDSITFSGLPTPFVLRFPLELSEDELIAFSRSIRPFQVEQNGNGELEIMSPNTLLGCSREVFAMATLSQWSDENGGVVISSQGGFRLSDNSVRMADASWIAGERWGAMSESERESFARLSPDFLIEICSKSDSRTKLEAKMKMWLDSGARLAWMIDPYKAEVLIYKPDTAVEVLARPDWVEAEAVVAGFRLETARMWAE